MKYIISDVHGCYKTLLALLVKLPKNVNPKDIIFVGDLIDRGPNSRKVIELIRNNGYDCLQGNHEQLLIEAWDDYKEFGEALDSRNTWTLNGGLACLNNYTYNDGDIDLEALEKDIDFLRELPTVQIYKEEKDKNGRILCVTHATSIAFIDTFLDKMAKYQYIDWETLGIEEEHQMNNMSQLLVWNRTIPKSGSDKFFNVSGHNIIDHFIFNQYREQLVETEKITKQFTILDEELGYACIDTAAFYQNELSDNPFRSKMTCLEFPTMRIIQQENIEGF